MLMYDRKKEKERKTRFVVSSVRRVPMIVLLKLVFW